MTSFLEEVMKYNLPNDVKDCPLTSDESLESRINSNISLIDSLTEEDNLKVLNSNVDNWMTYLKDNIIMEYSSLKNGLKEVAKSVVLSEIKRFEDDLTQLKSTTTEYKCQIKRLEEDIIIYKISIKQMSNKLSKSRNGLLQARCWYLWRLRKDQLQRQRFCEKLANKFYLSSLMRKTFNAWKCSLEISWKTRNNALIEKKVQTIYKQLLSEYEMQIVELKSEIAKLQEENSLMHTSRTATQDAVKKALLRGVCALNAETMNVLNQNGILNNTNNTNVAVDFDGGYQKNGDDQPRYPLYKYGNDNGKFHKYHDTESNLNSRETTTTAMMNFHFDENKLCNPYSSSFVKEYIETEEIPVKICNNNNNSKYPKTHHNDLSLPLKSTTNTLSKPPASMIIQAGNPTGSYTLNSNSSLNFTIQKHTTDNGSVKSSSSRRESENFFNGKRLIKK